ncbi:hypothetical protein ABN028_19570 [Actinopolymorpha sp. B17G11]|uniref:hypothetical protein n=1 Tax=Actinopolymorpha sp. B17G11 TaxID=3160861 RepID=UPI0032E4C68F
MPRFTVEISTEHTDAITIDAPTTVVAEGVATIMAIECHPEIDHIGTFREAHAKPAPLDAPAPVVTIVEIPARYLKPGTDYAPSDVDLSDPAQWRSARSVEIRDGYVLVHNNVEVRPTSFAHDDTVYAFHDDTAPQPADPGPVTDDELMAAHQAHQDTALRLAELYHRRVLDQVRAAYPDATALLTRGARNPATDDVEVSADAVVEDKDGSRRILGVTFRQWDKHSATWFPYLSREDVAAFERFAQGVNKTLGLLAAYTDNEYEGFQTIDI